VLKATGVYKVFGNKPEDAIRLLEHGKTSEEIYSETKQIVGVAGVDLEIRKGEIFVIMGLSGSGKSTLLRCLNRLVEPTRGRILVTLEGEEKDVTKMAQNELIKLRRNYVSVVFQHFALLPNRTVIDNVTLGLEVQGKSKREQLKIASDAIDLVGLSQWVSVYPFQLSGGMKQRVGLARALATGGIMLLMDEPFSALDPLIKYDMQCELLKLQAQLKKAILFVTHDLGEALRIGDRIAIMEQGRFVQVGVPEEIIINPKTEYVSNFVKSADPTDVVTAKSIMTSLKRQNGEVTLSFEERGRRYLYSLGSKNELVAFFANGKQIATRRYDLLENLENQGAGECETALVLDEGSSLRELIKAKLQCRYPLIISSENAAFKGIVTNQLILEAILKKFPER
jgi:glycine betaine/proline transport system ATP-binding protein